MAQKKFLAIVLVLITSFSNLIAQDKGEFMRQNGKFPVVFAVILIIFVGIIIYLINIDRKLTNLENQIKKNE